MDISKAAPRPWRASKPAKPLGDISIYADTQQAFDIAIVQCGGNDMESRANAALIVEAVNKHDHDYESLERALVAVEERLGRVNDECVELENERDDTRALARELAEALDGLSREAHDLDPHPEGIAFTTLDAAEAALSRAREAGLLGEEGK
jgi:hypothetical protein